MQVRMIVDATVDLIPELKRRLAVVPLTVHFGTDTYIDGVTTTHQEFYEKLVESDVLPSTSHADPGTVAVAFSKK